MAISARRAALAPAPAAPAIGGQAAKSKGRTVTVVCKHPNGLQLQLQREVPGHEQTPMGRKDIVLNVKTGRVYFVKGPAYPNGQIPKGFPRRAPGDEHGVALTKGIPADFWDEWLKQNKDAPYVLDGTIYAFSDVESAMDKAQELEDEKSGLEPIDPSVADPRMPKPLNGTGNMLGGSVTEIERGTKD